MSLGRGLVYCPRDGRQLYWGFRMKRGLVGLAAAAALVVVPLAGADANFTDPAGDAGGAPDVIGVVVSNDALNRVAFEFELAGKQPLAADGEIGLVLDTDQNAETGLNGWDYLIVLAGDESTALLAWNGTDWAEAPSATAQASFYDGYVLYGINRSELGNTTSFDLAGSAAKVENGEAVASDLLPDGDGYWSYTSVTKTYGLRTTPLVAVPKAPKAGARFGVGYLVLRTDSIEPLAAAKATCVATLAGKRIVSRPAYSDELAVCNLTVPKTAKGKLLKVTLKATAGGKVVAKTFSGRVR